MANLKTSEEDDGAPAQGGDLIRIARTGSNFRLALSAIASYVRGLITSSDVSGLGEAIDDRVAGLLAAGDNVLLDYDDEAGTLTISATTEGGGSDRSGVSTLTIASGVVAIDCSLGDYFTLALSANVTGFTFSNLPGAGRGASLMLRITQDATARTVAWPASFKWAGGTAGAVSTGSAAVDLLAITTFDNGTTWRATLAKDSK